MFWKSRIDWNVRAMPRPTMALRAEADDAPAVEEDLARRRAGGGP